MKTKISTTSKFLIAILLFSLLFIQVHAQCVASWGSSENGCDVKFGDNSTGSPTQWLWDFGDGQTDSLQDVIHTYSVSGTYQVCLTITTKNCTDSACQTLKINCSTTGISPSSQLALSLSYNNPVFSSADIHYSIPSNGTIKLTLFDVVGNKIDVLEQSNKSAGVYSYLLNTHSFSRGIYFINLDFEGKTLTKKIIIAE